MSIRDFVRHHYRHFNAATLVEAAEAWVQHLDSGGRMLLTLAGAMSTAELGLSLAEMGGILKAFGAYDAMACDAGGSACIFADTFGGIVNYPCDGEERPTYTHFGIRAAD